MVEIIHLFGADIAWSACGIHFERETATRDLRACTCERCLKMTLRDAAIQLVTIEELLK